MLVDRPELDLQARDAMNDVPAPPRGSFRSSLVARIALLVRGIDERPKVVLGQALVRGADQRFVFGKSLRMFEEVQLRVERKEPNASSCSALDDADAGVRGVVVATLHDGYV